MNPFLKRFQETVEMFPDREAVVDRDGTRSTSYRQWYEQAAASTSTATAISALQAP